jgi:four helix bundle protein
VPLNYTENFARRRKAVLRQFLEIAYGSLKESEYIIHFAGKRGYIKDQDLVILCEHLDKIGKMLWGIMEKIEE